MHVEKQNKKTYIPAWSTLLDAYIHDCLVKGRKLLDAGFSMPTGRGHTANYTVHSMNENPYMLLLVGCLTSQQHASASQGQICTDNFMCCHTEMEAADQTFHLTQSQYTDIGPTSPSADPITPGACQGSHWSANF